MKASNASNTKKMHRMAVAPTSSFSFNNSTTMNFHIFMHHFSTSQLSTYGQHHPSNIFISQQPAATKPYIGWRRWPRSQPYVLPLTLRWMRPCGWWICLCDRAGFRWNRMMGLVVKTCRENTWPFSLMICLGLLWWVYVEWLLMGSPCMPMLGHILHNTSCSHDTFG